MTLLVFFHNNFFHKKCELDKNKNILKRSSKLGNLPYEQTDIFQLELFSSFFLCQKKFQAQRNWQNFLNFLIKTGKTTKKQPVNCIILLTLFSRIFISILVIRNTEKYVWW